MLSINGNLFKRLSLCLALAASLQACSPSSGFLAGKAPTPPTQSIAIEPKTNSNDRPTETGAGVPGYLVNCSEIAGTVDQVQVGCSVASIDTGARIKTGADALNRYEANIPANANPAITVTRNLANGIDAWDVLFIFTGADPAQLRSAAQNTTYSYTYVDEDGKTQKVQTAAPVVVVAKPAPVQAGTSTCLGVLVENVCVVNVPTSCTDYCNQAALKVHPWVTERYGSGLILGNNKSACAELYAQFPGAADLPALPVADTLTGRGLGCYSVAGGRALFDNTPTDVSATPYIGYTRICACTN